jgi:hypothetical protein
MLIMPSMTMSLPNLKDGEGNMKKVKYAKSPSIARGNVGRNPIYSTVMVLFKKNIHFH